METKKKDKRKILLVLPILLLPFMTLAFYAMGGGKGNNKDKQQVAQKGINSSLPDAAFKKDEPQDKMGFYQQTDRDSAGRNSSNGVKDVAERLGFNGQDQDQQTKAINEKLEALNKEIVKPVETKKSDVISSQASQSTTMKSDVDRLETLMKSMKESKTEDPEMAQLNGMLQNILDIQHPDRIKQRIDQKQAANPDNLFKAIPAIIVDNQKAVQGATVKLRLQDSVRLNGQLIPKGQELFGTCRITNQRLLLDIKNIRLGTSIVPVDLSVYSLDGMAGINAPEAMLSDAVNGGASDGVSGMQFMGLDQSLGAQAAGAGIEAAKSLFSKKVKKIKVKLKAGENVLLKINKK